MFVNEVKSTKSLTNHNSIMSYSEVLKSQAFSAFSINNRICVKTRIFYEPREFN